MSRRRLVKRPVRTHGCRSARQCSRSHQYNDISLGARRQTQRVGITVKFLRATMAMGGRLARIESRWAARSPERSVRRSGGARQPLDLAGGPFFPAVDELGSDSPWDPPRASYASTDWRGVVAMFDEERLAASSR